jgi:hypothetical protein
MKRACIALLFVHCGGSVDSADAGTCAPVPDGTPSITSTCGGFSESPRGGAIDGDYVLSELRLCSMAGPTTIRETLAIHDGRLVVTTDATEGDGTRSAYRQTFAVSTKDGMLALSIEDTCSSDRLIRVETINPYKKYAFTATTIALDIYEVGPSGHSIEIAEYTRR